MHLKHYFCINLQGWGRKAWNHRSSEAWYPKGLRAADLKRISSVQEKTVEAYLVECFNAEKSAGCCIVNLA